MFNHQAGRKFSRRTTGIAATAGVSAALIALGTGLLPTAASAEPSTPNAPHEAAATGAGAAPSLAVPGLGTGNYIQSEDFFQMNLGPTGGTVDTTGQQALSACSGEETMAGLTGSRADAYASVTWNMDTNDIVMTESIAETSTARSAASYETRLNKLVQECRAEPAGHWRYGKSHHVSIKEGRARWYPTYDGDGAAAGGVVVIRSGHRFGILELAGTPTTDPTYIQGFAYGAIRRLAD